MSLPTLKHAKPHLKAYAQMLRTAMQERQLDLDGLVLALGLTPKNKPAVYNWVGGKNGPSSDTRVRLAKVLGLTEDQLEAPTLDGRVARGARDETPEQRARRQHRPVRDLGPAQRAVVLAGGQTGPTTATSVLIATEPVRDVFTIAGRSDGQIAVRLQTTLDAKRGMALARYLLDFGLIMGDHQGESEGA